MYTILQSHLLETVDRLRHCHIWWRSLAIWNRTQWISWTWCYRIRSSLHLRQSVHNSAQWIRNRHNVNLVHFPQHANSNGNNLLHQNLCPLRFDIWIVEDQSKWCVFSTCWRLQPFQCWLVAQPWGYTESKHHVRRLQQGERCRPEPLW